MTRRTLQRATAAIASLAIISLTLAAPAFAQAPSWPPGGITPSPVTAAMHLPDGRYVPSSRRWNLVWADQIVPQSAGEARVGFAAKHYAGTQKIWADQAAIFRAAEPNFLVLMYHLSAGLNPARNSDVPDPKSNGGSDFIGVIAPQGYVAEYNTYFTPWLDSAGIAQGSARFEEMFQHFDSLNVSHRVWHQDPYWLMNLDNADWRRYAGDICRDWMSGNRDEGCFFDVAVETNVTLYNPKAGDPAPWNFNWWEPPHAPLGYAGATDDRGEFATWMNARFAGYFSTIYQRFHSKGGDYLVIPNVDQMVTSVYDPLWTDGAGAARTIDGAMMEGFGNYRGSDMWLTLERGLRHITGRGKILIAQFGAATPEERLRRTAMYMLIKNENSFLNIINGSGVEWYPEYEIDLGDQSFLPANLDSLRVSGSGSDALFARSYQNGLVLCNTSGEPITYQLPPGEWSRIATGGGGDVRADGTPQSQSITLTPVTGSVTVAPSDGVILARASASGVRGSALSSLTCDVTSSAEGFVARLTVPRAARVSLAAYDLLGRMLTAPYAVDLSAGDHRITLPVSDLPRGIYLVRIVAGDAMVTRRVEAQR
jgi:hypothetical protein